MKLAKSLNRFTFQRDNYLKRKAEEGLTPENDDNVSAMFDFYTNAATQKAELEASPEWAENNMEYDLRSTPWIVEKAKASENYSQNLYAAMCNNDFQKNEFMPRLAGKTWSCSWRYAGGIVADMREEGDYIDWYCSGIRDTFHNDDDAKEYTEEQLARLEITKRYVSESVVTDEIREDLKKLGWLVVEDRDDDTC